MNDSNQSFITGVPGLTAYRPLKRPEDEKPLLTEAQQANIGAGFVPGMGISDILGLYPEFPPPDATVQEMLTGPRAPSLIENVKEGDLGIAGLQLLGGLGDLAQGFPIVGTAISGALSAPLLAARAARKGKGKDVSYRMQHTPLSPEDGAARLDDLTRKGTIFPDDVYSSQALRDYGNPNNPSDVENLKIIQNARNKPNAEVTIYRAVPPGVKEINPGDFVTLNPEYAELHSLTGYGNLGDETGDVIKMKVKVKEVFSDGNDLNEFGYYPVDRLQRAKDLGFDTDKVYYHGTSDADIKNFKIPSEDTGQTKTVGTGIFFSSSPDVANTYVKKTEKGVIYPVFVKKDKFLTIKPTEPSLFSTIEPESTFVFDSKGENIGSLVDFGFTPGDVTSTDKISRQFNNLSKKFPSDKQIGNRQGIIIENIQDLGIGETGRFNLMTKYLKSKGYESRLPGKGLEDKQINDQIPSEEMENAYQYFLKTIEEPSDVVVAFDPKSVRSVNADFETKNTANISKADGGEISSLEKGIMAIQNKALGGSVDDLDMGIMSIK